MAQAKPEPLNLQLVRITPDWAKLQRARRTLVVALYALLIVSEILFLQDHLTLRFLAGLGIVCTMTCFVWLIGATSARADMPDDILDERERGQRDRVYRLAFINLMGLIALGFIVSRFVPNPLVLSTEAMIGLLFFTGMLMPTAVYAWIEPDPMLED